MNEDFMQTRFGLIEAAQANAFREARLQDDLRIGIFPQLKFPMRTRRRRHPTAGKSVIWKDCQDLWQFSQLADVILSFNTDSSRYGSARFWQGAVKNLAAFGDQ